MPLRTSGEMRRLETGMVLANCNKEAGVICVFSAQSCRDRRHGKLQACRCFLLVFRDAGSTIAFMHLS